MKTHIDPEFSLHKTCTQLGLDMILNLAESPVLPLSPQHINKEIHNGLEALVSSNITTKLAELGSTAAWKVRIFLSLSNLGFILPCSPCFFNQTTYDNIKSGNNISAKNFAGSGK